MKKVIFIFLLSFTFFFSSKSNAIQIPTTYGGQIISLQEYQQYMDYCFYAYWMILDDVYNFNNESNIDLNYRLYGVEGGQMVLGFGEHILKCYTEQGVLQSFGNSDAAQLGKYNNTLKRGMSDRCLGIDWFDGNWFVYACNPETGAWHIIPNSVGGSANDRAGTYDCVNTKTWEFYGGSSYLNLVINKKKVFGVNYDESYYYRTFACVETEENVELNPTLTQLKTGLTTTRVSSDIGSTTGTGGSTGGTGTSEPKLDEIKTQLTELNNTNSSFQTQNLGKISEVKSEILLTNEQIAVNQKDLTTKLNILESKNDLLKADLVQKMNLTSATSELNNQNLNTKIDENNVNLLSQIEENDSKISSLQNSLDDYNSDDISSRNTMLSKFTDIETQLDGIENSLNNLSGGNGGSGVDLTDTNQGITNIDNTLKGALLDSECKSYLQSINTAISSFTTPINGEDYANYQNDVNSSVSSTLNNSFNQYSNVLGLNSNYGSAPTNITINLMGNTYTILNYSYLDDYIGIIRSLFLSLAYIYGFLTLIRGQK